MSSHLKGVYNPKAVILHATLLPQAGAHWGKFLAAASRRSLGRVSVPVCLVVLSDQGPVTGLVRRYHTNYLIGRRPLPERVAAFLGWPSVCGLVPSFDGVSPTPGQVTHVLLSRAPRSGASTPRATCMH
jgi:hypothetical protein